MKKWIAGAAMALIMVSGQVAADAHGDFPERPIMLWCDGFSSTHRDHDSRE